MNFLADVWNAVKAVFNSILKIVLDIIREFWAVIVIVALIYFAPVIAPWLTTVGAPQFLVDFFTLVGDYVTPLVASVVDWAWGAISGGFSAGYAAFADASIGVQTAWVVGTAALLAPDETGKVVTDAVDTVANITGSVLSGVVSGTGLGTICLIGLGLFFLTRQGQNRNQGPVLPRNASLVGA